MSRQQSSIARQDVEPTTPVRGPVRSLDQRQPLPSYNVTQPTGIRTGSGGAPPRTGGGGKVGLSGDHMDRILAGKRKDSYGGGAQLSDGTPMGLDFFINGAEEFEGGYVSPHQRITARVAEDNYWREQQRLLDLGIPPDLIPDSTSNGSGGSGYGYSGYGKPQNFDDYINGMIQLGKRKKMASVGQAPVDVLSDQVRTLGANDRSNVDAAWGDVPEMNTNAFRDYSPVQVKARDAQIAALLRAQGMGDGFAGAKQLQAEDDMALLDSFWGNYGGAMEANTDQSNARMNADRLTMAANDKRQIETQEMAMLAQIAARQQEKEEAHMQRQIQAQNVHQAELFQLASALMQAGASSDMDMSGYDIASLVGGV